MVRGAGWYRVGLAAGAMDAIERIFPGLLAGDAEVFLREFKLRAEHAAHEDVAEVAPSDLGQPRAYSMAFQSRPPVFGCRC